MQPAILNQSIPETDHTFLNLWPHRYDFIHAPHPLPEEKPAWKTERRFPLPDRHILRGAELFGIRFSSETNYVMLDIDKGSPYHPQQDPLAIGRLLASLEDLELVRYIACTSSDSGGLHLYFPFETPLKSWKIALAVSLQLEHAGFHPKPGWLEIFPNPRPYETDGTPRLYNAHRLPLQNGSYILDQDWQPIGFSHFSFVSSWNTAKAQNPITPELVTQYLKANDCKQYKVSKSANKFLNDLNTEIEQGWTGSGQTNYILGRVALRTYIFGHVLMRRSTPVEGQDLIDEMLRIIRALPGFTEFSNHVGDIETRVQEWARSVENSKYYPYHFKNRSRGGALLSLEEIKDDKPSWHQEKKEEARLKICEAIADLLNHDRLPSETRARFILLTQEYNIGGGTLYKNKDLWHPNHILPVENVESKKDLVGSCPGGAAPTKSPNLLGESSITPEGTGVSETEGQMGLPPSNNNEDQDIKKAPMTPEQIQAQIERAREKLEAGRRKAQADTQARKEAWEAERRLQRSQDYEARMSFYWNSGEPILMAEARKWAEKRSLIAPED